MKRTLPPFLSALGSRITTFKNLICLLMVLLLSGGAWGQVTVTNPSNTTPAMSSTYASLALAIADVNNRTAISGPVTITLTANQTAPAGGYSITNTIVTGGSNTNRFIFDGVGNTITAPTPQTSGNLNDAIFKIIGADFITIQNFTMQENASNTTTAANTNNMTEFGVALFYATTTNGAQNNIIQNNTISLNRAYQNTFGIFASSRTNATTLTTSADSISAAGANSNNKIYSNSISNINYAIVFLGSSTIAGMDSGNDIGGSSSTTGNIISNFCTSSTTAPSSYVNLTGNNYAIFLNHNLNSNVSNNSITSASSALTGALGGILQNFSVTPALGTTVTSTTLNNNTITLSRSAAGAIIGLNNQGVTTVGAASTIAMNNNQILNVSITITGTSAVTGVSNSGVTGVLNMNGNTVRGITSAASAGAITGVSNSGAVITSTNMDNNKCGDAAAGFATFSAANSGAIRLAENTGGATTCAVSIQNNDIRGVVYSALSSAAHTYITQSAAVASANVAGNTFTNLSINTSGAVTFISHNYAIPATGQLIINNNSIVTAFTRLAAGSITITSSNSTSGTGSINNYTNNNFSNIIVPDNASSTIIGFNNTDGGTGSTKTITGNTFNNWHGGTSGTTGTSSTINCMNFTYWNGVSSLSNNTITNVTGRSSITGVTIGSSSNNATSIAVSSNTINNLSSTGTGGLVLAISCSNTSATININSNAINTLSSTGTSSAVGAITVFGATTTNVFQNVIYDLSTSGTTAPIALGIQVAGGTLVNVYRNKIYNLSASGGTLTSLNSAVSGIYLSGGTTVNTFNNLIGNLTTPNINLADAIRGINIVSTSSSTSYNVYNNTVYLTGGSVGTNFGTSGISHTASATATTAALNLQNNMIFNTCTPSGTGIVTAYRRSSTSLGNYKSTSNKNLFYAGTPSATTPIMSDGTNNYQTLATFQTAVSTRDANSFTETSFDPATYFVSTTVSNSNYLQPASGLSSQAEGGGNTITMCSPDYNGVTRPGFSGAAYDVGAWEFAGVSPAPVLTNMTPSTALTAQCTKVARTISIDITTASGTITGATLNYNHNGTAQTAVTMTNSSGNTWTGTMLAPSTGNATVTWSITATNSLGLSTLYNGTSYADEPNTGITSSASATPSTVCSGNTTSLNFSAFSSQTVSGARNAPASTSNTTALSYGLVFDVTTAFTLNSVQVYNGSSAGTMTIVLQNNSGTQLQTLTTPTIPSGTGSTPTTVSIGWNIPVGSGYRLLATTSPSLVRESSLGGFPYAVGSFGSITSGYISGTSTTYYYFYNWSVTPLVSTPSSYSWSDGSSVIGTSNPQTATPSGTPTYTCTATVNGCPMTASVTPTVNPLPTAPTATNSSQCGAGIPTASVADNNSYTTPTFKWYSAPSGGTALQTSTSTTYTTSINISTIFYVAVVNPTTGCESSRTSVTVTVTQPDAISAVTSASAICLGQSVTLTAANTAASPTQNYSYSWVCATTGSGATSANTNNPASVTPTAAGSYTYTVTGTDGGCSAVNTVAVTVNALPNITSATATPSTVCSGEAITLTGASVPVSSGTSGASGNGVSATSSYPSPFGNSYWGAKQQFIITASDLASMGLVAGNITAVSFDITSAVTTPLTNYQISAKSTTTAAFTSTGLFESGLTTLYSSASYTPSSSLGYTNNKINFTTPFYWNGTSNVVFEICFNNSAYTSNATCSYSTKSYYASCYYYSDASGNCSQTNGYYISYNMPNMKLSGQVGTNQTSLYTWAWNSTPAITAAAGSTTETNTGTSATSKTYTVTATNSTTGCTNTTTTSAVTINPAPVAPTATNSSQCGSGTPTCSVTGTGTLGNTFKWYLASTGGTALVGQTGSTLSSYPVNATTSFYVSENNGTCESTRVQVDVTITAAPTIAAAATLSTICSGSPTVLSVTSDNSGYTYTWSNSLGSGTSVTASPTSTTTYTVTGTDSSGGANNGCATTATVLITVNSVPTAVTLSPSTSTNLCIGEVKTIVASGGNSGSPGNVTLGTGTTTLSTSSSYAAFNGYRASSWIQTIYTASELSEIGLAAGNITSIAYNINSQGSSTSNNITIKIGTISDSNFTTTTLLSTSAFTTVYGPTAYTHSASGWQTINFATPYNWDGVSNIVVDVWQDGPDLYSDPATYYSTTSDNKVNYTYDVTPSATPPTGVSTTSRFNVKFTGNVNTPQTISWSPTATLYTDSAATNAYTGNPRTVYAKPTATTTYTATATSAAGCTSSNTVTVNVNPTNTAGTASSTPTLCANTVLTSITHATTGATGIGTATSLPTGVTAAWASDVITISGTPTASGTFNYSILLTGGCGTVNATGTITVNPSPTALVLSGSLACAGSSGSIASSTSESGVDYQLFDSSNTPVGAAIAGTGSGLSWSPVAIANGYYAKATNTSTTCMSANSNTVNVGTITDKTWTATTGNWSTASNWSCNQAPVATDIIVISSGSPVLDTDFTVGAGGSLTLSGSGTLTISPTSTLTVTGTANFGSKAVTIKSDATGTGAIGQVTGNNLTGATNVTVERYLPAKRAWRALTAPLKGSVSDASIFSQWQNNGDTVANTGVELWGPAGDTTPSSSNSGLKVGPNSSILQYVSGAWSGVTNTNETKLFTTDRNNAFMVFPTGPYNSGSISSTIDAVPTTLKATGQLITGEVTYSNIPTTSHTLIGNPYASPINLNSILDASTTLEKYFWVWDPRGANQGAYNMFDADLDSYTFDALSYNDNTVIQSGQAFFVKAASSTNSFTINENNKSTASTNYVFRNNNPAQLLRVGLYKQENNEWSGRDGAMTAILSDAATNQTPNKMANGSENIAFVKNGSLFASNHHLPLVASDVLNIRVWRTTAGANYKLKINTEDFVTTNLSATLEDLFTNSRTPLNLEGAAVEYPFTVTTDALSTGDRFRIVFQNAVLGTNNPTATGFSIVPNPVTGDSFQVNLGTLATGIYTYSIYNAIGQEVEKGSFQNTTQNTNYEVKMSNSATGIYIMKIKGKDNTVFTAKIIKK